MCSHSQCSVILIIIITTIIIVVVIYYLKWNLEIKAEERSVVFKTGKKTVGSVQLAVP